MTIDRGADAALIYIIHANKDMQLDDAVFSENGDRLALIGRPWGDTGLSEIYLIDIDTLELTVHGQTRRHYRYAIPLREQGTFFAGVAHVSLNNYNGRPNEQVLSIDPMAFVPGYIHPDGERFLLETFDWTDNAVVAFDAGLEFILRGGGYGDGGPTLYFDPEVGFPGMNIEGVASISGEVLKTVAGKPPLWVATVSISERGRSGDYSTLICINTGQFMQKWSYEGGIVDEPN